MEEAFLRKGWPPLQAQALAELIGDDKPWGDDGTASSRRQARLRGWANNRNVGDLDTQLAFLTYELRTVFGKLVQEANKSTDVEGIKKAFALYTNNLRKETNHGPTS